MVPAIAWFSCKWMVGIIIGLALVGMMEAARDR